MASTTKNKRISKKKKVSKKKSTSKKRVSNKTPIKKKVIKKSASRKKSANKINKSSKSNSNQIVLKAVLTIGDAKVLLPELKKKIDDNRGVTIDASAVEMIDTAILQLLLSFIHKINANDYKVNWHKPSREFISRAETLNLSGLLGVVEATV